MSDNSPFSVSAFALTPRPLSRESALEVRAMAEETAKLAEIARTTNREIAAVGGFAIGTVGSLVMGAGIVRKQLADSGHDTALFHEAEQKVLEVTGHNIILLTNEVQKGLQQKAAAALR